MLSRSAQHLYWMGRYLERVDHLCRLMEVQVGALVDRHHSVITYGWERIYESLVAKPPSASIREVEVDEDNTIVDSYALTQDLMFEPLNPYSVWRCFQMGRENARQIRHLISSEMWLCLNLAYLRIQGSRLADIWLNAPEQFFAEIARDINTFFGVASATMYRDEGWEFLHLGRSYEHVLLMSRLLSVQAGRLSESEHARSSAFEWSSLLNCYQADEVYQHDYGLEIKPEQVLNMLVTNPKLPCSLIYAIEHINERIRNLGEAPGAKSSALAGRFAGRLEALIKYEWPDAEEHGRMLNVVETIASRLNDQITDAWFVYRFNTLE